MWDITNKLFNTLPSVKHQSQKKGPSKNLFQLPIQTTPPKKPLQTLFFGVQAQSLNQID
jgi:hypothetical protein